MKVFWPMVISILICTYGIFICVHIKNVQIVNQQAVSRLEAIFKEVKQLRIIAESDYQKVTLTAYHPRSGGINSDNHPNKTALMITPKSGWTLAISTELVNLGWLGKKIYIDGWGIGKAEDRMGKTVEGKRIDICSPSLKAAVNFGVRKEVLAIVLN